MSTPKAERSQATRAALVTAARELFARDGYAATPTTAIVTRAGVTRGALYHHFRDKEDLFRAVYEAVEQELTGRVVTMLAEVEGPLEQLRAGAAAFLDACLEPDVQRIVLLEGPTILGWSRWREIDQAYGLGLMKTALQVAVDAGAVRPLPVEPMAHVLLGALVEAGMLLAHAPDPETTRAELGAAIDVLVGALQI